MTVSSTQPHFGPRVAAALFVDAADDGDHVAFLPTGQRARLQPVVMALLWLCDGARDVEALARDLASGGGPALPASTVRSLTAQLIDAGLLTPGPLQPTQRGELRASCMMCGNACEGQRVGPLPEARVAALRPLHEALARDHPRVAANAPFMLATLPNGEALHFLNFPDERCVFLGEDRRCLLHARFGPGAKPDVCNRFPVLSVEADGELRIGLRPLCYRLHRTFAGGDRPGAPAVLDPQAPPMTRRPVLRPPSDAPPAAVAAATVSGRAQERELLGWLDAPDLTLAELLARVAGLPAAAPPRAALPPGFSAHLARELGALPGRLGAVERAVPSTGHGRRLLALVEGLRALPEGDAWRACAPLPRRWLAYARFGILQALFLRETSRFPSVAIGALVFALGPVVAAWLHPPPGDVADDDPIPDGFGETVTAWNRLMCQSDAFEALFPTQEHMTRLMATLVDAG